MRVPLAALILLSTSTCCQAEGPLLLRAQNLTVTPSTGPVTHVVVRNCSAVEYKGKLSVRFPADWKVAPAEHALDLKPGETRTLAMTIQKAVDREANVYPVTLHAEGSGGTVDVTQEVVCASAPYNKPTIDGELDEWKDSLPITFTTDGRKTVVRSYWSSKQFSLAVEVEGQPAAGTRAIQFALSAGADVLDRYEFLVVPGAEGTKEAACYALFQPGDDRALIAKARALAELRSVGAQAVAVRSGGRTVYEVSVPFKQMPEIKPAPGREITFGLLVHEPGEPAPRDLGSVMNRWPEDRRVQGWCSWQGVRWGPVPPFDAHAEFGFCSSIH